MTERWPRIDRTLASTLELAYVLVLLLDQGYALSDLAMRDGNLALVGSASNLIPIVSTAISAGFLGVPLRTELLGGAALVVLGALLSQAAFRSRKKPPPPGERRARGYTQAAVDGLLALPPATRAGRTTR